MHFVCSAVSAAHAQSQALGLGRIWLLLFVVWCLLLVAQRQKVCLWGVALGLKNPLSPVLGKSDHKSFVFQV